MRKENQEIIGKDIQQEEKSNSGEKTGRNRRKWHETIKKTQEQMGRNMKKK